jgi:tetratricopeptide (TPR) repeat protein
MPVQDPCGTAGKRSSIEGKMTEDEEKDIDLIEKYHKGVLSDHERRQVTERMAGDPVFATMVEDYTDIFSGIRSAGKEKFKATVAEWETEIKREEQQNKDAGFFSKYWQLAAVLLIVALVAVYFLVPGKETPEALYASYFVPYEDVLSVRDNSETWLTEAMHFYNQKEYSAAADRFRRYIIFSSTDPKELSTETFYWGISLLESGKPDEAVAILGSVIYHEGLLKEQAEWYRALAYLKMGDIESCRNQLMEINRDGNDYQMKAAELLGKL